MRLLHTSDWHLGHTLHSLSRVEEHRRFLAWLLDTLVAERVDALVIAGDVFDTANPSVDAQTMFFDFLGKARRALPDLDVVVVGGNHDSPGRLDAPVPVLRQLHVRVVGGLPRDAAGGLDLERVVVPLCDRSGAVRAWCGAVPFLRVSDLPRVPGASDAVREGIATVYREVTEAMRARRSPDQALVLTGHLFVDGGEPSELSERRILGGGLHAQAADLFPEDVAYVALGHLHRAQAVGDRATVRYCGSPIPLALPEVDYHHQVCLVDLHGPAVQSVRVLPVPRTVEILRVPADGPGDLEAVRERLQALPERDDEGGGPRPFVEVRVLLEAPRADVRALIEADLADRHVRLVRIGLSYTGEGGALADEEPQATLDELTPEEVFRRLYATRYEGDPAPPLLAAFGELVDAVHQGTP